MQDFQRREELVSEVLLAAADAGDGSGRIEHAAVTIWVRVVGSWSMPQIEAMM